MNKQEINKQIKEKIKVIVDNVTKFKQTETKFKQKTLKLIKEVLELKRIDNPDYKFCDFLKEKEIKEHAVFLEQYIPYKELSTSARKLFVEGKLNNTDVMVLANLPKPFLTPKNQNKIITKILTKEVKTKDLIGYNKSELYEVIDEQQKAMEENRALILEVVYQLKRQAELVSKNKEKLRLLLSKRELSKLKDNFNLLRNTLRFGLGVDV